MHGTVACRYEFVSCPRCALLAVAQAWGGIANLLAWRGFFTDPLLDQVLEP
jgi:hypothetical protein